MITASFVSDKTQFALTEHEVCTLKLAVVDGLAMCAARQQSDPDFVWEDSVKGYQKLLDKLNKL